MSEKYGFAYDGLERENIFQARKIKLLESRVTELEAHLREVCGLTVEAGTKKIVETMNAAEAAITHNVADHRPGAGGVRFGTATSSPGSVHLLC